MPTYWTVITSSDIDEPVIRLPNDDIAVDVDGITALGIFVTGFLKGKVFVQRFLDELPSNDGEEYLAPPVDKILVLTRVYCSDERRASMIVITPKRDGGSFSVEIMDTSRRSRRTPYVEVTLVIPPSLQQLEQLEISTESLGIGVASFEDLYISNAAKLKSEHGSISAQLLRGAKLSLSSDNGSIMGHYTSGGEGLKAQSENGSIHLTLSADPEHGEPDKAHLRSDNGRIEGTLHARDSVKATTDNGSIDLTAVATVGGISLKTETGGIRGTYTVEKEESFYAKSDNGTVQVTVLGSASKVVVRTETGDIKGYYQAGDKFEATTEHGSVQAEVVAAASGRSPDVKISTDTGSIRGSYDCAGALSAKSLHGTVSLDVIAEPGINIEALTETGSVNMKLMSYFQGTFDLSTLFGSISIRPSSLPDVIFDTDLPRKKVGRRDDGSNGGKLSSLEMESKFGSVSLEFIE